MCLQGGTCGIWARSDWRAHIVQIVLPQSAPLGGVLNVTTCGAGLGATLAASFFSKVAVGTGCPLDSFAPPAQFTCPSDRYTVLDCDLGSRVSLAGVDSRRYYVVITLNGAVSNTSSYKLDYAYTLPTPTATSTTSSTSTASSTASSTSTATSTASQTSTPSSTPPSTPSATLTPVLPCEQRLPLVANLTGSLSGTTGQRDITVGTSLLGFDPVVRPPCSALARVEM